MGSEVGTLTKLPDFFEYIDFSSYLATSGWKGMVLDDGVRNQWVHVYREVWVKQHLINHKVGDLTTTSRIHFLRRQRRQGTREQANENEGSSYWGESLEKGRLPPTEGGGFLVWPS